MKRDADIDKYNIGITLNNILEEDPSFSDDFEEIYSIVSYWMRRAEALEKAIIAPFSVFCPGSAECADTKCKDCVKKWLERCGEA